MKKPNSNMRGDTDAVPYQYSELYIKYSEFFNKILCERPHPDSPIFRACCKTKAYDDFFSVLDKEIFPQKGEALYAYPIIFLNGPVGIGKSTLIQHVGRTLDSDKEKHLPVIIDLNRKNWDINEFGDAYRRVRTQLNKLVEKPNDIHAWKQTDLSAVYRYLVFHIYHVIAKAFGTIEDRMDDFCQWRFIRHPYRLPTLGGSPDYAEAKENIRKEWKDHKQMPGLCIEYCIFYLAHREGRNILLMIDNCDPKGIDTLLGFFSVGSHMLRCFNSNECLNDDSRKADFWEKHPFVDRDKKLGGTVLMPHLIRLIITARPSTVHGFKTAYAKDSEAGLNAFPYPELRQMTDAPRVTEILENRYDLMEYREKEKDSFIRIGEDLVT